MASSEIVAGLGENDVIASFRSERRCQTNIQLVWFSLGSIGRRVVPQRIAGLDPLNQCAEHEVQVRHVFDLEDFSARLLRNPANVHHSRNHARGEER